MLSLTCFPPPRGTQMYTFPSLPTSGTQLSPSLHSYLTSL